MSDNGKAFVKSMNDCITNSTAFQIELREDGNVPLPRICEVLSAIDHAKRELSTAETATLKYQRDQMGENQRREKRGRSAPAENDESGIYSMDSMTLSRLSNSHVDDYADPVDDKKDAGIQESGRTVSGSLIAHTSDSTLSLLDKNVLNIDSTTNE